MKLKPPAPSTTHPRDATAATARSQAESVQLSAGRLLKTRADFRLEEFRKLIQQKGVYLVWRKALLCTCRNPETDQPRPDCTVCDSTGLFYVEPILVQGVMSGLEKRKDIYRNLGEWLEGSAMLTLAPEHRPGFKDSFEMRHAVMVFNEWIIKGNRRGVRSDLPADHDAARYRIVRALHVMCPNENGAPVGLEEGIHFEITSTGLIKWLSPGKKIVKDGTTLTVNYEFHPVWVVMTHPHGVRDTVVKFKQPDFTVQSLPVQAAVKLDYLTSEHVTNTTDVLFAHGTLKE